ncbi:phage protease [Undibacterium sp. TJN25]|uniref:phage protease n=1 Tax=Undibacterium sp. TJN25 TaxID=3413056 RepID=UPI003BF0AC04
MQKPPTTHQPHPGKHLLAVAACSLALTAGSELQLLPAGTFAARDGRPADAPGWQMNAELARTLIQAAGVRATPYVIDYEHQTMLAKQNGQPAPAAGWFSNLEWREGVGLFAIDVDWTDRAKQMIAANEYRFISPVIGYDKQGAVTALYMAAITNNPAIDGMEEVLLAAATQHFTSSQHSLTVKETGMDEILAQLRWLLNMAADTTAEQLQPKLQALTELIKQDKAVAAASFDLVTFVGAQRTQIATLTASTTPDPAKFVPIETVTALHTQIASLSTQLTTGRVDELVKAALKDGKLVPAQESWARDFGAKDYAALSAYIENAPPIAALTGLQSGKNPPAGGKKELTPQQVQLCAAMGVSTEAYLKTLQGDA